MILSILIVNWNSKNHLRKCLLSIRMACAGVSLQIIVVDSASFDGCGQMLASEFPEVEFIQSSENVGFGRANNLGFSRVRGDFLLLLNPDTELRLGAVAQVLDALRGTPGAGIAAPRLLNSDGSVQTISVRALPTPLNRALDSELLRRWFPRSSLWGTWEAFHSRQPLEVEAVSGACMFMRADVFRRLGGFSPQFFMYGEDMDLCVRARRLGLKVLHIPGAEVVHHGGGSSKMRSSRVAAVMMRQAGETYMILNHGAMAAWMHRGLQAASALARLFILLVVLPMHPRCRGAVLVSIEKWWGVLIWSISADRLRSKAASKIRAFVRAGAVDAPTSD